MHYKVLNTGRRKYFHHRSNGRVFFLSNTDPPLWKEVHSTGSLVKLHVDFLVKIWSLILICWSVKKQVQIRRRPGTAMKLIGQTWRTKGRSLSGFQWEMLTSTTVVCGLCQVRRDVEILWEWTENFLKKSIIRIYSTVKQKFKMATTIFYLFLFSFFS